MSNPTIGLLPLYLELYDKLTPERRPEMDAFVATIADELKKRNLTVTTGQVCRVRDEFAETVAKFEDEEIDAIVTLHLAYSPSLESASVLADTDLPIIILDTTPDASFDFKQAPDRIMYNHGIHGVQDMCNLLIRNGKSVHIEAGHWRESNVVDRVADWAKAAHLAQNLRTSRTGLIGEPFSGMGDFAVPFDTIQEVIGVETVQCDANSLAEFVPAADSEEVEAELAADRDRFIGDALGSEAHRQSVRAGLAVRWWIEAENLSAMTANFLGCQRESGFPTVPFLEASKGMTRGIGYAGEGDVLCAAMTGALMSVFPETTFTEMFCPDWKNDMVFLSHMGEINVDLLDGKAEVVMNAFPIPDTEPPVKTAGRLKAGDAVLVNLAPGPDDAFSLVTAKVAVQAPADGTDAMPGAVRAWVKPNSPLPEFLAAYSQAGGTHHLALTYSDAANVLAKFAKIMGWRQTCC